MKRLMPVLLLLTTGLYSCKKGIEAPVTTTSTADSHTSIHYPYVDTFSGAFLAQVGENSFTSDSGKTLQMYVTHPSSDSIYVSGNVICENYYYEASGTATYQTHTIALPFAADSSGIYYANPSDHVYEHMKITSDSLYISVASQPGSCLINQLQTFAGKKQ